MNLLQITQVISLYLYTNIILASVCTAKCTRYARAPSLDNRIIHNASMIDKSNIGECLKSCFENIFCVSFIFNIKNPRCVHYGDDIEPSQLTKNEDGWIFFSSLKNVAYKKKTFQSSTHMLFSATSDRAVDGISDPYFFSSKSCTSTDPYETHPYWFVDLGKEYDIHYVKIINRGDCCPERLHDVDVTVAGSNMDFNVLCDTFKGPGSRSQTVVLQCLRGTKGPLENVAYNKTTFQSSMTAYFPGPSELAVDGNSDTNFSRNSCTHTNGDNSDTHPYWYVDLGKEHYILQVEIINRGDCCAERLHDVNFTIAGFNMDFNVLCNTFVGPGAAGQTVVLECPRGTKGRYVKLQIVKGTYNILTLCEVKVIGI